MPDVTPKTSVLVDLSWLEKVTTLLQVFADSNPETAVEGLVIDRCIYCSRLQTDPTAKIHTEFCPIVLAGQFQAQIPKPPPEVQQAVVTAIQGLYPDALPVIQLDNGAILVWTVNDRVAYLVQPNGETSSWKRSIVMSAAYWLGTERMREEGWDEAAET